MPVRLRVTPRSLTHSLLLCKYIVHTLLGYATVEVTMRSVVLVVASAVPSSFASLIPSLDQDSNDVGRLQG